MIRAERSDRVAAALGLAMGLAWLGYTRLYFWLHPRHLTADPSLFMYLTGRPDPTCGLTRTFAWMWRGDLGPAVAVYPLGPLVWAATLALVGYFSLVLLTGSALRITLAPRLRRGVVVGALLVLGMNWAAKLLWLGM